MTTLFLAWQDTRRSRGWYPIGRLDADLSRSHYHFHYVRGAARAHQEAGLQPLASFPDFHQQYESEELFPLFRNRVLPAEREEFAEYLRLLDLRPEGADPLEILALSEGRRQTDNLEVFPKISRTAEGGFRCRFFLHGWRHVSEAARQRLQSVQKGDPLRVALELNNPATKLALQLQTVDYHMIGWTPRYLVADLSEAIETSSEKIQASIVKINPDPAPSQQRVLAEMSGNWPPDYEPMSSEDFQDINP